jgi:hypothetical protein
MLYPDANIKWYGTARHISEIKNVTWETGEADIVKPNSSILSRWQSEGVFMSIPEGAEFINPGHFSCVFVYHQASRSLHVDDTIMYFNGETSGCMVSMFVSCCLPVSLGASRIYFHPSMLSDDPNEGLMNCKEAPYEFKIWLEELCDTWDFRSLFTAHSGALLGGAKEAVRDTIKRYEGEFRSYAVKYKEGHGNMGSIY